MTNSPTQAMSASAAEMLNEVKAYLDRLATKGIIHPNKAANYKSALEKGVNAA